MKDSFASQLATIQRAKFAQVPRLRYAMQVLLASQIHSVENRAKARERVLDWARNKWPGLIPPKAYEGVAFDHDQAGLRISATGNSDGSVWAFRAEHLDTDSKGSRSWVTEALVSDVGSADVIGVRNSYSAFANEEVSTSSPRFLRELVHSHSLVDGGVLVTARCTCIDVDSDLMKFCEVLLSPSRTLPILVISQLPTTSTYAVDPNVLAKEAQGLAHVYCINAAMTFTLTNLFGKQLSVFHGAVRTYYPGFSKSSEPLDHHLALPNRIAEWTDAVSGKTGANGYISFIVRQLHHFSVNSSEKLNQLPNYFSIRKNLLDKPNKSLSDELQLLRMEVEESNAKVSEWQAIADDLDAELQASNEENRTIRAQNMTLLHELQHLRQVRGSEPARMPSQYSEIPRWVESFFSERLFLHARALRALKDANFENIELVCACLKLLANAYWPMKVQSDPSERQKLIAAWEEGLMALKVEYNSHAISENRLGEFREQYTISHKIGRSVRQILGPHLKFGSSKDERFCMRIYFLWDDERELVVIGHLPSHLETRAT